MAYRTSGAFSGSGKEALTLSNSVKCQQGLADGKLMQWDLVLVWQCPYGIQDSSGSIKAVGRPKVMALGMGGSIVSLSHVCLSKCTLQRPCVHRTLSQVVEVQQSSIGRGIQCGPKNLGVLGMGAAWLGGHVWHAARQVVIMHL